MNTDRPTGSGSERDDRAPRGAQPGRERRPGGAARGGEGGAGRDRAGASGSRTGGRSAGPRAGAGRPGGETQRERLADRVYDPRREERRRRSRVELPDDITPDQLDRSVRADLRSLAKDTADLVARHLVATGRLLDEDPAAALAHARAATALGGRVGAVREAAGLAAYAAGEWQEALGELRTFRRITGEPVHLPVLADCERALGRPERALAVGDDPEVARLDQATKVELALVIAGARRDLGQPDAAVVLLQGPARATTARHPWAARLWYGYADALLDAGRTEEAEEWFGRVVDVDGGETDADDRLLALQGVEMTETAQDQDAEAEGDEEPGTPGLSSQELSDLVAAVRPLASGRHRSGPREPVGDDRPTEPEPQQQTTGGSVGDGRTEAAADVSAARRPVPAVSFVQPTEHTQGDED